MTHQTVLAIDLGAESGRVMAVHCDGSSLRYEELHRFPNLSTTIRGTLYWDFLHTWQQIQDGVAKGKAHDPASLGVDTWGVDFALIDAQGSLLDNPVHYRDSRTDGMMDWVFARVPKETIFERTGIQFMQINTLYQLASLVRAGSPQLAVADTFLMAPDLINYWLTGEKVVEYTIATTSQMVDARSGAWAVDLLEPLSIPIDILPSIVLPGTRLGRYEGIPVIAPGCHDTASAVAAVPTSTDRYAYISSGTWSLVGLETRQPVIDDAALAANVTNEGGIYGTVRLLRNVAGLWLLQQCRSTWQNEGHSYEYADLVALAEEAPPLCAFIDPNDARFLPPGDLPRHIRAFCQETGQTPPAGHGAIVRCVLESLALAYRDTLETLLRLTGRTIDVIHVVGGGSQNHLLCQMTADATGIPVRTGPVEATVLGNALVQLIALGEIEDIEQGRQLVATMPGGATFEPQNTKAWNDAFERYKQLLSAD